MQILYFDCFSGISGDMTIGALLDLGIDKDEFINELSKLDLDGYTLDIKKVVKSGITGTSFDVILDSHNHSEDKEHIAHSVNPEHDNSDVHIEQTGHSDNSEHDNSDEHYEHSEHTGHCVNSKLEHTDYKHEHVHVHVHSQEAHGRSYRDICEIINKSSFDKSVKEFSLKVFEEIAIAEGIVHNKPIEDVHFHEVGAIDSIIDIVGVGICLKMLGVESVYSSPIHDGTGFIECQHGIIPVPVPAVVQMLKGSKIPYLSRDIHTELVTPTGLGIIKSLTNNYGVMPAISIKSVGYGMGKRDTGSLNALRIILGDIELNSQSIQNSTTTTTGDQPGSQSDEPESQVAVIETNIDDSTGEILGYTMEKLLEEGALDVYYSPIYMKKNRPSYMLSVICKVDDKDKFANIILSETSSIGVRMHIADRIFLNRRIDKFISKYGEIRLKVSSKGDIFKVSPEYEDIRKLAKKFNLPLEKVLKDIMIEANKNH